MCSGFFMLTTYQDVSYTLRSEAQQGTLEQLYMSVHGFGWVVGAKVFAGFFINLILVAVLLAASLLSTGVRLNLDLVTLFPVLVGTLRMMKTYKYKLYQHKRNRCLKRQINLAGIIYNHCIALHRRYYRLYGKTLNVYQLMKHLTKLKKLPKYSHWNSLGSQAIQDIAQRINRGYTLFFRN